MKKTCIDCKAEKAVSEFYSRILPSGGIRREIRCKKCQLDKYSPNRGKPNAGRFKKALSIAQIKRYQGDLA